MMNTYLLLGACALLTLLPIFFWARGVRKGYASDLIAGPAILLAASVIMCVVKGTNVAGFVGCLFGAFGIVTLVLRVLEPPKGVKRCYLAIIGYAAIIIGICFGGVL